MEREDIDQIRDYLAGDPTALDGLIEKYKRPLYSYILNMTERRGDSDEIFQETWFRALKNLSRFQRGYFLAWLFRIARNLVIDRSRRTKRLVSFQAPISTEETNGSIENTHPTSALGPAEITAGKDLGKQIDRALQSLSPEQREVFILRMQAGLPFKEIAKIQRCSINTSLARMQYALTHLRSMLKEEYLELRETPS